MGKFTPGKWKAIGHRIIVDGHVLAIVNWSNNARLIAAAPEMYELLQSLSYRTSGMEPHEVLKIHELLARIDDKEA